MSFNPATLDFSEDVENMKISRDAFVSRQFKKLCHRATLIDCGSKLPKTIEKELNDDFSKILISIFNHYPLVSKEITFEESEKLFFEDKFHR